ncbi:uncharacterized protein ASPGLDRAFT_1047817 [Aspergillus glaucus CBS 516.65]|uniref:Transcription factor domain-containing protein n=1 Tax=Aspergillus glaucus CBS 516.65 TaxID=1160497 RepID=A0A1L9V638_ASPGL|nr:hypothetical protein ASPGLDRAFT_1047817 [Aspergillus glaucus CBS 516.65]OJJ79394.1 hypothetical protein ASPGLDRAFT_1047817 [Aspergillus glaucus CBS 516.65]
MNAILALASQHLALNTWLDENNIPNKEEEALQYYHQTLYYVQRAMQYPSYQTSLELLTMTLIISAYEMLDNSTNDWEWHLEGVFLIQRSQTIHGESSGLHSAVWWKPLSALSPHELATRAIYITTKVLSYCAEAMTEENIQPQIHEVAIDENN